MSASFAASAALAAGDTAFAALAALTATATAGDTNGAWMLLVPAGKFEARDGRGFDAGDKAAMEAIVARTRQYHAATDIVVDYDHQSVFGAKDGVGGTARAAGWIKELQVRDDGIWGRVEWTASARASIEAGEYRYLSPVIPHRKDGSIILILNAALTNTPALDLTAAAASARFAPEEGSDMEKTLAALGLAKGSGEDAVLTAVNAMLANSSALASAAGITGAVAKHDDVLAAITALTAERKRFAEAVGLGADAKADDVVAALTAKASPDPTKWVPIAVLTELRNEVKALKEGDAEAKASEVVEAAMKAGQITPAQKDWALSYAKQDLAAFSKFVEGAPTLTASQLRTQKRQGGEAGELDDAQLATCKALGLDPKTYAATLAEEAKQKDAR